MEEKAVKPSENSSQAAEKKSGTVRYAALGYVSTTIRDIPNQISTTTLTMC